MDAEPWRLRRGGSGGDGDGRNKMKRVVNHGLWRSYGSHWVRPLWLFPLYGNHRNGSMLIISRIDRVGFCTSK
jgi:hypothetical protein